MDQLFPAMRMILLTVVLSISMGEGARAQPTGEPIPGTEVDKIEALETRVQQLDSELARMRATLQNLMSTIQVQGNDQQSLNARVSDHASLIAVFQGDASKLHDKTSVLEIDLGQQGRDLGGRLADLDQRTGMHWTLTLLLVAVVFGLLVLAYLGLKSLLGKRVGAMGVELEKLNADMQAKLVKVDTEFVTALEKLVATKSLAPSPSAAEEDHSLALKVADEITRIEQNLAQMDASVKGHKQLGAAVKRMNENLVAAGYQLPPLLGKSYDDGMKLSPTFVPDDNLKPDERIITRVFKPTVLFQGQMIQVGEVQVSTGN